VIVDHVLFFVIFELFLKKEFNKVVKVCFEQQFVVVVWRFLLANYCMILEVVMRNLIMWEVACGKLWGT